MTTCKTSQGLWDECLATASTLFKRWRLISYEGVSFPPDDGSRQQEESEGAVAGAIYTAQQTAYEQMYRWANDQVTGVYRDLRESDKKDRPDWRNQRIGGLVMAEKLMDFLRPMIADNIDDTLQHEESTGMCGHCDCSWTQDVCCWCGQEFGEGGAVMMVSGDVDLDDPEIAEAMEGIRQAGAKRLAREEKDNG